MEIDGVDVEETRLGFIVIALVVGISSFSKLGEV